MNGILYIGHDIGHRERSMLAVLAVGRALAIEARPPRPLLIICDEVAVPRRPEPPDFTELALAMDTNTCRAEPEEKATCTPKEYGMRKTRRYPR